MYEYHIQAGIAHVGPDNRLKPGSCLLYTSRCV